MTEQHQLPPGLLLRSFLVVGLGYILSLVIYVISAGLFLSLFVKEQINPDEFSADPAKFLTGPVFWSMLGVNFIAHVLIGCCVAWLAPFAKFPHCVFFAVLIVVTFLQQTMGVPANAKWMYLVNMAAFAFAVLIGGHFGTKWSAQRKHDEETRLL